MTRLRVGLDATPLLGPVTGVGQFCSGALGALAVREDTEVSAFAVSWRRRGAMVDKLPPNVRAVTRPMPARPMQRAWSRFDHPVIEWWTGKLDVVHGTNYVVPPSRRAARVVTVHDLTTVRFPELCDASTLAFPQLVRRAVARGAWVHTPSQFVADEVVEVLGVPAERVRAVHHGVGSAAAVAGHPVPADPAGVLAAVLSGGARRFIPSGGARRFIPSGGARRFIPSGGARRFILCLGTIEPRKDLPSLVAAFEAVSDGDGDLVLVVAGPDGWGTAAFEEAVAKVTPAARHRIVRTGYVDAATREALIAGATVFVYPSLYEGFGFPPLEAMEAGVPVVATRAGAVPEVVGDAALLVEPGDVDGLTAALATALGDAARRADLVQRGRARAASFAWDTCAQGLMGLYRDALAARS